MEAYCRENPRFHPIYLNCVGDLFDLAKYIPSFGSPSWQFTHSFGPPLPTKTYYSSQSLFGGRILKSKSVTIAGETYYPLVINLIDNRPALFTAANGQSILAALGSTPIGNDYYQLQIIGTPVVCRY